MKGPSGTPRVDILTCVSIVIAFVGIVIAVVGIVATAYFGYLATQPPSPASASTTVSPTTTSATASHPAAQPTTTIPKQATPPSGITASPTFSHTVTFTTPQPGYNDGYLGVWLDQSNSTVWIMAFDRDKQDITIIVNGRAYPRATDNNQDGWQDIFYGKITETTEFVINYKNRFLKATVESVAEFPVWASRGKGLANGLVV